MIDHNFLYLFLGMKARGAGGVTLHIAHLHQPATFVFQHGGRIYIEKSMVQPPSLLILSVTEGNVVVTQGQL